MLGLQGEYNDEDIITDEEFNKMRIRDLDNKMVEIRKRLKELEEKKERNEEKETEDVEKIINHKIAQADVQVRKDNILSGVFKKKKEIKQDMVQQQISQLNGGNGHISYVKKENIFGRIFKRKDRQEISKVKREIPQNKQQNVWGKILYIIIGFLIGSVVTALVYVNVVK